MDSGLARRWQGGRQGVLSLDQHSYLFGVPVAVPPVELDLIAKNPPVAVLAVARLKRGFENMSPA